MKTFSPRRNPPAAPDAGIASRLTIGHHWPGIGEPERWCDHMRRHLDIGLVVIGLAVCTSCDKQSSTPADSPKVQWGDPATLKAGPIRHEQLSDEQIQRIAAVQKVFSEVDPTPPEKWIEDFKREMNPDRELAIWETMAVAYSKQNSAKTFSPPQRNELFGVLLMGSGASEDEAIKHLKLKVLSEAEARNALRTLAEEWGKRRQSDGPANGSQPVSSETNTTSSAPGSPR